MTERELLRVTELASLRAAVIAAIRNKYASDGVIEARVPTLVDATGSCEQVDTLFLLQNARAEVSYLTQTGQLNLEAVLTESPSVWCLTASFRNDSNDTRHLPEFDLVEEEFCWNWQQIEHSDTYEPNTLFQSLLTRITEIVRTSLKGVLADSISRHLGPLDHIERALTYDFAILTYDEALAVANERRGKGKVEPPLEWGADLSSRDEMAVMESCSVQGGTRPTFVTLFPREIKYFNMKVDKTAPATVLSADLLLPAAGEAIGAAVREDDPAILRERLERSSMLALLKERGTGIEVFEPYLHSVEQHSVSPHAGYGIGLERLLQFITLDPDIRNVSLPSRLRSATLEGGTGPDVRSSTINRAYRWWTDYDDEPSNSRSLRRALAWLDTPNAQVSATRIGYGRIGARALIDSTRQVLIDSDLPDWKEPIEAVSTVQAVMRRLIEDPSTPPNGLH